MNEIERKFLLTKLPKSLSPAPIQYERYFLKITPSYEERVQKKGDVYQREKKIVLSDTTRKTEKTTLSKQEFDTLKKTASKAIIRESYAFLEDTRITIKIYRGDYEGLSRAEVEFLSEEEAKQFAPLEWMGQEITHTALARDARIIQLSKEEFQRLLNQYGS